MAGAAAHRMARVEAPGAPWRIGISRRWYDAKAAATVTAIRASSNGPSDRPVRASLIHSYSGQWKRVDAVGDPAEGGHGPRGERCCDPSSPTDGGARTGAQYAAW